MPQIEIVLSAVDMSIGVSCVVVMLGSDMDVSCGLKQFDPRLIVFQCQVGIVSIQDVMQRQYEPWIELFLSVA